MNRCLGIEAIERAPGNLACEIKLVTRAGRNYADRSADRVASEQRALRPFEYLDTLNIQQLNHRTHAAREINAVDINADTGLKVERKIGLAYTANVGCQGIRRAAKPCCEIQNHSG